MLWRLSESVRFERPSVGIREILLYDKRRANTHVRTLLRNGQPYDNNASLCGLALLEEKVIVIDGKA